MGDALQLRSEQADGIVREANMAFLLNILLFEERDVAAGHLKRIRTIDEIAQLVGENKTPLEFQKAYKQSQASGQCPFIPGPAGRRPAGAPSFHANEETGVCPWPFVWLHDPRSAVVAHPKKNVVGFVALGILLRVAWKYPIQSLITSFATAVTLQRFKPKKGQTKDDATR